MENSFYIALEKKFRGSKELVVSRLENYRPILRCVTQLFTSPQAIDLGCGRGEWMGLLREEGIEAIGVDLNSTMLEECRENGFRVYEADALEFLKRQPDQSVHLLTGFHIVEHLPFEILLSLIEQAHRVLKLGGVVIFETPNPENLSVATSSFYIDPSHIRLLPSELLSFILEYVGFETPTVIKLNSALPKEYLGNKTKLLDVLVNVNSDYSIVAIKNPSPDKSTELTQQISDMASKGNQAGLFMLAHNFEQRIFLLEKEVSDLKLRSEKSLASKLKRFFSH